MPLTRNRSDKTDRSIPSTPASQRKEYMRPVPVFVAGLFMIFPRVVVDDDILQKNARSRRAAAPAVTLDAQKDPLYKPRIIRAVEHGYFSMV